MTTSHDSSAKLTPIAPYRVALFSMTFGIHRVDSAATPCCPARRRTPGSSRRHATRPPSSRCWSASQRADDDTTRTANSSTDPAGTCRRNPASKAHQQELGEQQRQCAGAAHRPAQTARRQLPGGLVAPLHGPRAAQPRDDQEQCAPEGHGLRGAGGLREERADGVRPVAGQPEPHVEALRELRPAVRGEQGREHDQQGDEGAERLPGEDQAALRAVDREVALERAQHERDERALRELGGGLGPGARQPAPGARQAVHEGARRVRRPLPARGRCTRR